MADSIMYQGDCFVVLETEEPEQFLSYEELLEKLKQVLQDRQHDLPRDLKKFPTLHAQAQYLLDNFCELDLEPGQYLQWYIV